MGYARVGSNPADVATILVHFWPSGLRRYVQVVVFIRRRRFESCGVHILVTEWRPNLMVEAYNGVRPLQRRLF